MERNETVTCESGLKIVQTLAANNKEYKINEKITQNEDLGNLRGLDRFRDTCLKSCFD